MAHPRPAPPRPDLMRRPAGPFGWLDARLVHDGWLGRAGAEATAVVAFLAIVAGEAESVAAILARLGLGP